MRSVLLVLLAGCGSAWNSEDLDGDGWTVAEGDCFDNPDQALSNGMTASEVYPGKSNETWYDGVDENCDGLNDYDKDGDGHPSLDAGEGDDCWDDPENVPAAYTALSGFYQPIAREVYPGAAETYYDGVDSDCDTASDFDQDLDGYDSAHHERAGGALGDDCFDAADDDFDNEAGLPPANVNPGEAEIWYDGTDGDCDGGDDFDQDGDGYSRDDECDDSDPAIYPNDEAEVWYDGVDSNCDGLSDYDQDYDGFDALEYGGDDCLDDPGAPAEGRGGVTVEAEEVNPAAADAPYDEIDADCAGDSDFDADGDGQDSDAVPNEIGLYGSDCDDESGAVYEGAIETWYDGTDSDCSGGSDYDQDGDGFDFSDFSFGTADDCDDTEASVNPGGVETCATESDDDCDGRTNEEGVAGCTTYFHDGDSDGYGDLTDSACYCEPFAAYDVVGVTAANDDCNDAKFSVNPGVATEDCSTTDDEDCDGSTNELGGDGCSDYYVDADGDTYGTGAAQCWCEESGSYSATRATDCDDGDQDVHPGASEVCNLSDDDCDGTSDEGVVHYYDDADGDGYGDDATESCTTGSGFVSLGGDCNDADAYVYPTADELCDERQNDCDATAWTATDEEGTVSYETTAGVWSDVTSTWAAGTAATPAAIALSSGTYHVCPGTWYTALVANNDTTDVVGPYGATDTILSRAGTGGAVVSSTNSLITLEGLTITGGIGSLGGSTRYGGGVISSGTTSTSTATVTLIDCLVTDNTADYGGGIAAYNYGVVVLDGTDVYANTAATSGGGAYIQKGSVTCTNGGIYSNSASSEGGGAWFYSAFGSLTSTSCDWTGNSPDDAAGGAGGFTTKADSAYGAGATFSCAGNSGCL